MMQYQQGDLLITLMEGEEIPEEAVPAQRVRGRLELLAGEFTGHVHAVAEREVEGFKLNVRDQHLTFLVVPEKAKEANVVHEEHNTITLPPGKFKIERQREVVARRRQYVAD